MGAEGPRRKGAKGLTRQEEKRKEAKGGKEGGGGGVNEREGEEAKGAERDYIKSCCANHSLVTELPVFVKILQE